MNQLSQRNKEGYFCLDHSQTIGLNEQQTHDAGLPPGAGRGLFEAPTYTCSHCQSIVIVNPDRKRDRAYCTGCDHLICDNCGAIRAQTRTCKTFKQVMDEAMAAVYRQTEANSPLLLP